MLAYNSSQAGETIITGLSTDTKPASPGPNWIFIEKDTMKMYNVIAGAWNKVEIKTVLNIGISSTATTSTTFVAPSFANQLIGDVVDYCAVRTVIKAVLIAHAFVSGAGVTGEIRLFNLTDNVAVAGTTVAFTNTTVALIKSSPEVAITPNKVYRIEFRKSIGAGGAGVTLAGASIQLSFE